MSVRLPSTIALACIVIISGIDCRAEAAAAAGPSTEGRLPSWNEQARKEII